MNTTLVSGLLTLAAATPFLSPASASADDACSLRVLQSATDFPLRSQLRGQEGTVFMAVTIDTYGRATTARLHQSSGHRALDRAAQKSVVGAWVFDISGCARKDLPADLLVAVEYRNEEY
jgi:TonB family protein